MTSNGEGGYKLHLRSNRALIGQFWSEVYLNDSSPAKPMHIKRNHDKIGRVDSAMAVDRMAGESNQQDYSVDRT